VGKSKVGVDLAVALNGEVVSGDSMQVYRHMDIGTAKIKPAEMKGIPHHLLDIKDPDEQFSVAEFQKLAQEKIEEIAARGRLPVLVGGTGLYIQSVIDKYNFEEQKGNQALRKELYALAAAEGNEKLHKRLALVDPVSAEKIHKNDLKRITRALEYYHLTGRPISANREGCERSAMKKYNAVLIGLTMERRNLYEAINKRVDTMLEEGLLEEVQGLLRMGYSPEAPALQGLGYSQLIAYLKGEHSLEGAVELIKRDTRRFAKRQLTWFRRDPRIYWFRTDAYEKKQHLLSEIMTIVGRTIKINVEY
jgi:tRNA dimethylallyltransferase